MKKDDPQLIYGILSGDETAFSDLVKKYEKSVHAHAWRKIGDYHIAEEITQDTFIQAHKKLSSLRNPDQFAGWLYVITDRLCIAWLRKKKLYIQSLESVSEGILEKTAYANYVAEQREEESTSHRREIVESLLQILPHNERTVMVLHYLGEMSCEAIGKFLGISPNTVRSRVGRARNRLRFVDINSISIIDNWVCNDSIPSRNNSQSKGAKPMKSNISQGPMQWKLPENAKVRLGKGKIRDIQYSPDGTILAVASSIGIWLYDIKTYQEIALLTEYPSQVVSVAFSPDGRTIVSGSMDGTIHLWDRSTTSYKNIMEPPDKSLSSWIIRAPSLAFSPDGKTLACGYQETIHICDAITGEIKNSLTKDFSDVIIDLAFSLDGKTIYCSSLSGEISHWNVSTGKHKKTLPEPSNNEHRIAFNTNEKTYAVSNALSDKDFSIYINDLNTGDLKFKLTGHTSQVYCLALNPEDNILASTSYNEKAIHLWDAYIGKVKLTLATHESYINKLAFSPDGKTLVGGSSDGVIRFWDANTGKQKHDTFTGHIGVSEDFAFTSNGQTVTTAYAYGAIREWDAGTGQLIKTFNEFRDAMSNGEIENLMCIPDGKILAWGNGGEGGEYCMCLWDAATGRRKILPTRYEWNRHSLASSPDGKIFAIALSDKQLRICDMLTGEEIFVISGQKERIFAIEISQDNKFIATTSEDNGIHVWDTHSGEIKYRFDVDTTLRNDIAEWRIDSAWCGLAFSPDGKTLACGGGEIILLWDMETGENTKRLIRSTHRVFDLDFSPDGKILASAGFESNINLWDPHTGDHVITLMGHTAWVRKVKFSPDSKSLGSRSDDGTVLIWNINS